MDKKHTPPKVYSHRSSHHAFILWGDKFEEEVTTVFATELRRAGLSVKLVGVAGPRATGAHGLVISCDLTLGDALPLANQAICVILPCSVTAIKRLENDPRVHQLFKLVGQNQGQFIVQHTAAIDHLASQALSICPTAFAVYNEGQDLIGFARKLAGELSTVVAYS
ncbi:MAG: DJ-1/PfpI family protein [Caldilineaceae bacterium]